MSSLKKNLILNALNTVSSIIFPIITFPYAARVLLPDGIGIVNFQQSIINYIILLTSLGIPLYAVKEIAKCRDNKQLRNKVTLEILILNLFLCVLGYIAVFIIGAFVPQVVENAVLFYILSLSIIFSCIGVDWFYKGIEDFKYITIRAIIIRFFAAILLFVFVRDKSDILEYGIVVVSSTVGNNFINFLHLRKYAKLSDFNFSQLDITRHLKPALHIFVLNLVISIYVNLNPVMIGFLSNNQEVGEFSAGIKITHVVLALITSTGGVIMPHCSNLLQTSNYSKFVELCTKSLNFTVLISIPIVVGLILLAEPITLLFCGDGFYDSINILYWNSPVILFIGITNVIGIQTLYPLEKVNVVIASATSGAIINVVLNLFLIPEWGATGAAISTFFAEFSVLVVQIIFGYKYLHPIFAGVKPYRYIIPVLAMGFAVFYVRDLFENFWLSISISTIVGFIVYFVGLIIHRDKLTLEVLKQIRIK